MSQFIISSKESRIETNRSFYGCFYLGPFEPSQSITIANTLRRTLLSEIYGLAIVSVEIEGASHEYSSLPGVNESVLDILLNIKEIVLKKTNTYFTPQIGYLKVQGPGVVTASHLRLPPFIQCVDPDQYIATLSHNGCLNIKFIIQYGNKWLAAGRKPDIASQSFSEMSMDDYSLIGMKGPKLQNLVRQNSKGLHKQVFNFYFKKRRLFLKKLRDFGVSGSNSYIKLFSKNLTHLLKYKKKRDIILKTKTKENLNLILKFTKKYPGINLKNGTFVNLDTNHLVDKSKIEHKKVAKTKNVLLEGQQSRISSLYLKQRNQAKLSRSTPKSNKDLFENRKKKVFFNVNSLNIDAIFNPITKVNYIIEINDFKIAQNKLQTSYETSELYETLVGLGPKLESMPIKQRLNSMSLEGGIEQDLLNLLSLNQELSALTKETIKHNIILEIWTNGSLHPRDALNQALKNLIKVFIQLKNVQPFSDTNLLLNSNLLTGIPEDQINNIEGKNAWTEAPSGNKSTQHKMEQYLFKKMKMGELKNQFLESLVPLNETNYLSTYVSPKVKSYYFDKKNLSDSGF